MGRDGWIALGLLAFSGWLYSNLGKIPANPLVPIGPAFYPRILLVLIILLSSALIVRDLVSRRGRSGGGGLPRAWVTRYRPSAICFLVFALYVLFLPVVGFLISTIVFVAALQWLLGPLRLGRLAPSLLMGVTVSVACYLIFEVYLRVLLPRGTLFP